MLFSVWAGNKNGGKGGLSLKCIKSTLSRELNEIVIHLLSDWHIGSRKADTKAIKQMIDTIRDNPNHYCIILGDLINNATRTSVSDCYEEALTPQQQINCLNDYLYPIKDKILGAVSGNHEGRTYKTDGIDLLYNVMAQLGIQDRYDSTAVLLFLRLGTSKAKLKESNGSGEKRMNCYTLYLSHGSGGGATIGGKANKLKKKADIVNADIVVAGHTHQAIVFPQARYEVDTRNNSVYKKITYCVNADALLDYEAYAETFGLPPGTMINPTIALCGKEKRINVTI